MDENLRLISESSIIAYQLPCRNRRASATLPLTPLRRPVRSCSFPPRRMSSPVFPLFWSQAYFFAALAFFSSKAACAAASRAMGTRKGEQLT